MLDLAEVFDHAVGVGRKMTDLIERQSERLAQHGISDAAQATGCTSDSLRYYERAGVLPEITRSPTGQRLYSDDDLG